MRIIIIGAVAAGTSAAAKARRNNKEAEIIIYEKDNYISYSGCGMPYYIGGIIDDADKLSPRGPEFFKKKYNVEVKIMHEVVSADAEEKSVRIKNLVNGEEFADHYDKLIFATGAHSVFPDIEGIELPNVFTLRNINDMNEIKTFIESRNPEKAVIIGAGYIGLELCENLKAQGMNISLIVRRPNLSSVLDEDMSGYLEEHLKNKNITLYMNSTVQKIEKENVILNNAEAIPADIVLVATGVRPNVDIAEKMGVELGVTGAIKVNEKLQTSILDVYACGDCIEQFNLITGKPVFHPLGSTANKTGRIAGEVVTGGDISFRGILGTGIFQIMGKTVAVTGLSQKEAEKAGYEIITIQNNALSKPGFIGGKEMVIKAIAEKITGRLLGVQIIGEDGVDKRIDVFATAITFKAKAEDLFHLDLAYAPPFSTPKDPVIVTGMILENLLD